MIQASEEFDGQKLFKQFHKWLKVEGNSRSKAAYLLGYQVTDTISQWVSRKNIPLHQRARVHEMVNGK